MLENIIYSKFDRGRSSKWSFSNWIFWICSGRFCVATLSSSTSVKKWTRLALYIFPLYSHHYKLRLEEFSFFSHIRSLSWLLIFLEVVDVGKSCSFPNISCVIITSFSSLSLTRTNIIRYMFFSLHRFPTPLGTASSPQPYVSRLRMFTRSARCKGEREEKHTQFFLSSSSRFRVDTSRLWDVSQQVGDFFAAAAALELRFSSEFSDETSSAFSYYFFSANDDAAAA